MESMHVVVIGQGYVGLPLAQAMSAAGLRVTGLDSRPSIVESLLAGRSHVDDLSDDHLSTMLAQGYRASSDAGVIASADVVVICVPTPLTINGEPDLAAIESAARSIATHATPGTLVVLESTTYPGTTDDVVKPLIESGGLTVGVDLLLAFSPERIDPGNATYTLANTPKVVGGVDAASTAAARAFYERFVNRVVTTKGAREAETAKLLENTYRHVNIALVNEMARFCHDLGIDIWDVIDAAETKPFGFEAFRPGPGVGGHCIPIDPNYLSFEVRRKLGYPFRLVELAEEINSSMPSYVVDRVANALARDGRALAGATVLLLGVTYKRDIADQRESPATDVAEELRRRGARVEFHDPYVEEWSLESQSLTRVSDLSAATASADIVVLLQAHRPYDIEQLVSTSIRFLDCRGVTDSEGAERL